MFREEVLNVALAKVLSARGLVTTPETIQSSGGARKMPDVLVLFHGLRVILEGKVGGRTQAESDAAGQAAQAAVVRLLRTFWRC